VERLITFPLGLLAMFAFTFGQFQQQVRKSGFYLLSGCDWSNILHNFRDNISLKRVEKVLLV
jgi:hypothetical protein